jgi:glycosyltransferase involved in cell wall biosynthesis
VNHEKRFSSLELFFTKIAIRFFNRIITHSHFAKNEVKKVYNITDNSKIQIIPHGNYIKNYKNTVNQIEARNKLKIDEKEIIFMYFGLIRPYKGVFELIEAFKKLNVLQKKLLIVGKPCSNEIAKNIRKRCNKNENIKTIYEFIPDNEIQIYMNAADVVVLPYRDILTSGAAILAMSFSKPVIAPAIGCIPEALDREGSFLYDPSVKDGLIKAMRQAPESDLEKMGRHNFKLAKQLGWDEIAKKTYEVYCECLKKKR